MTISDIEKRLKRGDLIVYMGYKVQIRREPKPIPEGEYLVPANVATVYIDDMNYGYLDGLVGCFDVGPGTHKLEVVGNIGGKTVSTDARPARIRDGKGLIIAIRVISCLSGIFFEIKEYDDVNAFVRHIGHI